MLSDEQCKEFQKILGEHEAWAESQNDWTDEHPNSHFVAGYNDCIKSIRNAWRSLTTPPAVAEAPHPDSDIQKWIETGE